MHTQREITKWIVLLLQSHNETYHEYSKEIGLVIFSLEHLIRHCQFPGR